MNTKNLGKKAAAVGLSGVVLTGVLETPALNDCLQRQGHRKTEQSHRYGSTNNRCLDQTEAAVSCSYKLPTFSIPPDKLNFAKKIYVSKD